MGKCGKGAELLLDVGRFEERKGEERKKRQQVGGDKETEECTEEVLRMIRRSRKAGNRCV